MESYEQCGQGRSYCSLCTLDTTHRLFFVTRLIINKINKVPWVDFKLENVLVSLHSLKTMALFLRNGELLGHSPIRNVDVLYVTRSGNFSNPFLLWYEFISWHAYCKFHHICLPSSFDSIFYFIIIVTPCCKNDIKDDIRNTFLLFLLTVTSKP
jgi:hypothetical protein